MGYKDSIFQKLDKYCELTGKARSTVANLVMNDGKFFDELKNGRSCTMKTYEKIMRWFEEHMPTSPNGKKNGHHGSEHG